MNVGEMNNSLVPSTMSNTETPKASKEGFDSVWEMVANMNTQQVEANNHMSQVILGKSEDTHGALIALEKASMQMQLATKVRDELIQGYNKLINIQI